MATNGATSNTTAAPPGNADGATSLSWPPTSGGTECEKGGEHGWSYAGVALKPRLNGLELSRPPSVEWLIYRCSKCKRLGRARPPPTDTGTNLKFERRVVELPEFRPDARERFGWSLRDSLKKERTLDDTY